MHVLSLLMKIMCEIRTYKNAWENYKTRAFYINNGTSPIERSENWSIWLIDDVNSLK